MSQNNLNRFFLSIVMPAILAIVLFVISIFVVILPSFERNIMKGKKEMISELTNTVCSLLDEYDQEAKDQHLSIDSARILAVERVREIRYGDEQKDYFWIIDRQPVMIMHPYRPELIGSALDNYKDPEGKRLFVESVSVVEKDGEGFVDYMWQWKDDSTRIVPKLSYVKWFESWDWIVGTGIYLEDVRLEIHDLKRRLLRVALLISLTIITLFFFIIRQSLKIETRRRKAEDQLRLSKEKYKSLVEASTEGTLMLVGGSFIFSNLKFSDLSGYDPAEVRTRRFEDFFSLSWSGLEEAFRDPKKTISRETRLTRKDGTNAEVVLSTSMIQYSGETGYILVLKEISAHNRFVEDTAQLSADLQTSLSLMNLPIGSLARVIRKCPAETTIREAALLMTRKNEDLLFIQNGEEIIGIVSNTDLVRRVMASGQDPEKPVTSIMTSPVVTLSDKALLYEALLAMKQMRISHIAVRNSYKQISGVVDLAEVEVFNQDMAGLLIREIENAEEVDQIARIYRRLPVLVKALIDSGCNTGNITRIITSVADAIHRRLIVLSLETCGPSPCRFAFMVMGSLGREEQTLNTDQDNALLFEEVPESRKQEVQSYFLKLGRKINEDLNYIGYHLCQGEIMARNPEWNQDLKTWKGYFSNWIIHSDPKDILDVAIFFDFRCIYGELSLVEELREHVHQTSDARSVFFYHMAQTVIKMKPPLDFFGRIKSDPQSDELALDLKKLLLPVSSFVRLYAIREKLSVTNSMERAIRLSEKGVVDIPTLEELTQSLQYLTFLRIRAQSRSITRNEKPANTVNVEDLNHIEVTVLKKLIADISGLQTRLGRDFTGGTS